MISTELLVIIGGMMLVVTFGLVIAFVLLFSVLRQNKQWTDPTKHVQTDLTSMVILFSTMRDFLSEQKQVATDFNRSLDKKIGMVRHMVEEARRERQELHRAQHRIAAALAKVHEELGLMGEEVPEAKDVAIEERYAPAAEWTGESPVPNEENAVAAEAETEAEENADDFIDSWTGVNFDLAEEEEAPAAPPTPKDPEDEQAARNAFRSLLNFGTDNGGAGSGVGGLGDGDAAAESAGAGEFGELLPIERQVYDYDDAGMRASEIARELGVEKSQVRAILAKRESGGS